MALQMLDSPRSTRIGDTTLAWTEVGTGPPLVLLHGLGDCHRTWRRVLPLLAPHHRLPLLSWLPQRLADRYLRLAGKGDHYYEHYYTPAGLRRLFAAYDVWDYTLPVLADPVAFAGDDIVPAWVSRLPERALAALLPAVPTYVWLAFKGTGAPEGPDLAVAPRRVR